MCRFLSEQARGAAASLPCQPHSHPNQEWCYPHPRSTTHAIHAYRCNYPTPLGSIGSTPPRFATAPSHRRALLLVVANGAVP